MSDYLEFYRKVDPASIQAGRNVYVKVSIPIDDFNTAFEHYVNHVIDEITKRDVEQVSESLRALGWEEVVRCKDCVRYSLDDYGNTWCAYVASAVQPDDFCAWGVRREP